MTYQDCFIPGSPLIICCYSPRKIGEFRKGPIHGQGLIDSQDIPRVIKRQVTEAEYYATIRPEFRDQIREMADPGALFYEVSVD